MSLVPEARKKLQRTQGQLIGVRNWSWRVPPWDFDELQHQFYDFITVGRSVAQTLLEEEKPRYDAWLGRMKPRDRALWDYLKDQRDSLTHAACPQLIKVGEARLQEHELYDRHRWDRRHRGTGASFYAAAVLGVEPPKYVLTLYGFDVEGEKIEVLHGCERYLKLLEDLFKDFEEGFPY